MSAHGALPPQHLPRSARQRASSARLYPLARCGCRRPRRAGENKPETLKNPPTVLFTTNALLINAILRRAAGLRGFDGGRHGVISSSSSAVSSRLSCNDQLTPAFRARCRQVHRALRLRSKGRNTVVAYECSLTRAQKVAGFECHMERSMLAVDGWIEKHPEWLTTKDRHRGGT